MLLTQTSESSCVATAQSSETANRRRQFAGIYVYTVSMHEKEPQEPPFAQSKLRSPTLCICPGSIYSRQKPLKLSIILLWRKCIAT